MEPTGGNPAALVAALRDGTFPRRAWDHRAHLVACWSIHREHHGPDPLTGPLAEPFADPGGDPSAGPLAEVVDVVRVLISAYNLRTTTGLQNLGAFEFGR